VRVALDATPLTLSSGGLRRYVTELSLALAREFPEDTYTLLSDQAFLLPRFAPPNLRCGPESRGTRWWLSGVRRAILESGSSVFHGTNFEVPYIGATPAVMTIHDLSPWRDPAWHSEAGRVRTRTPWLLRLRRARMVLTVSEAVRKEVIGYFGIAADKVRAVPLAASPAFTHLPDAGSPSERPFFLFVGTLEPRKNVAGLIEAWRSTCAETGADLILVGRRRADLEDIAPCDGLTFIGEVPDHELPRLYSRALAFVYPSYYEGFGLPVLEAMQCGCPVITSNDPAITEVAGGAAIHAGTPLELANALRSVARDPSLRDDLQRAGLKRAAAFSWERTARATREIYAEALL
jgi:glycosyltransferase involved in cell wall biosynthesis